MDPSCETINIIGARQRNLKNISLSIPKKRITVFTGVSGSGKSSLLFDTIAAESRRQLNETYTSFIRHRLPHYGRPDADRIENLPVSFVINQKRLGGNARSTVGTITDIYSLLRLLYSRIGRPFIGYSDNFSFNNPQGMCERCGGIGRVDSIDTDLLLNREKSLNEGAVLFPTFGPDGWRIRRYIHSGLFDNDKKLRDYSSREMELLLYTNHYKLPNPDPQFPKTALYEGLIPRIERSFLKEENEERRRHKKEIDRIVSRKTCPGCRGSRLNETVRSCKISGKSIADCSEMQIDELLEFIRLIRCKTAETVLDELARQLEQMVSIGLGYLNLGRETPSLSGGESQRIKMVKQLGSSLCDVLYIFDEPSIGLHPYNVDKICRLLRLLRDKGNTILIVEHDPDIIGIADHVVDMGPKAGGGGGEIVFQGSYEKLKQADTATARHLSREIRFRDRLRKPSGYLVIENASLYNLKQVSVKIPTGAVTVVTGVAGSGKSSLVNGVLAKLYPESIAIDQKGIQASKRSNIATYTGIFDLIRRRFAEANRQTASLFSFNSKGACPQCRGLGILETDLAFMDAVETVCDVCEGRRYTPETLRYKLQGRDIGQVLDMTVHEAAAFFRDGAIQEVLCRLCDTGLEYITLGQSLDTLSGGELQRVKLAARLESSGRLYLLDEPTTGLHMSDIARLTNILNRLADQGNTLVVIEHNPEVIAEADWVVDLGPGAGHEGGRILFEGTPAQLAETEESVTGKYLRRYLLQKRK